MDVNASATEELRARLVLASLVCLTATALFAASVPYLAPPDRILRDLVVKSLLAALALTAYILLRHLDSRRSIVAVGVTGAALTNALCAVSAILAGEAETLSVLTVLLALGTAALLPWGTVPQVTVALTGAAAYVGALYGVSPGSFTLAHNPSIAVALGLGLSIFVAAEVERGRRALAQREAERQRATDEVRRLNDVLEERVATRTAALERSEAALSALIENAPDAIWSVGPDYRLLAFNSVAAKRFQEQFGSTLHVGMRTDTDTRTFFTTVWKPLYERGLAGERFRIEHSIDMRDGPRRFVVSVNPIVSAAHVTGIVVFSTDITDQRRAEAQARAHRDELTHVLRLSTVGELAAGLAHEINQPLGAIVNYASGLVRRLRADPAAVSDNLPVVEEIADQALRAGEIIRRLRRLVSKEAPLQQWFDLDEAVTDAVSLMEPDARDLGIALRRRRDGHPRILGDRIQIEQVILNLVRNAIEAMSGWNGRRELTVDTRRVDDERVEVTVRDSGPGIPDADGEPLFVPYFSTKPGGLGMGLAISRSIAEAHEGCLRASPNPDGGATFCLTLPVRAP